MLQGYFQILERERPAIHWISKCLPADIDIKTASLQELRDANRELSSRVQKMAEGMSHGDLLRLSPPSGNSLLDLKIEIAERLLSECAFCERRCGANRKEGNLGYCGVGALSRYSSDFLHMGEEPELVPSHTIFFSGCTFKCVYCQNWDIAMHPDMGRVAEPEMLRTVLLEGISQGSRNANFVGGNPDPNLHTILKTIALLGEGGKFLPMIWNSNMYTSLEAMEVLWGVIDVYLGDFRYGNDDCALELSDVRNYFEIVKRNFAFAYRTAIVMLRHLVMPDHLECCTRPIMEWVSENMPGVYFNLMFQYRPEYKASLYPRINRYLTREERRKALEMAREFGISCG